jgi:hypothetical protein
MYSFAPTIELETSGSNPSPNWKLLSLRLALTLPSSNVSDNGYLPFASILHAGFPKPGVPPRFVALLRNRI